MDWYYVSRGQQVGPVPQSEFERLVSRGAILAETLVWRQGMAEWRAYGDVAGAPGTSAAGAPGTSAAGAEAASGAGGAPGAPPVSAVCSECGRAFPVDEVVSIAGRRICAECKPAFLQRMREGSVPAVLEYGGFWIRFGARVIDGIILWIVNTAISLPVLGSLVLKPAPPAPTGEFSFAMLRAQLLLGFIQMVVAASYETLFVGRFAATPGKMACRLKVVRPDGGRVSYARALGRYGGTFISAIIFGIGYLIAAFDEEKRTLHDRICDTRVIRR